MSLSDVEGKLKNEIEKWQLLGIGDWYQDDNMDSYDSESDENYVSFSNFYRFAHRKKIALLIRSMNIKQIQLQNVGMG